MRRAWMILIQKIREDIQTVGKECFKLQVGPLEDTSNPAQLLDLVTSLVSSYKWPREEPIKVNSMQPSKQSSTNNTG